MGLTANKQFKTFYIPSDKDSEDPEGNSFLLSCL